MKLLMRHLSTSIYFHIYPYLSFPSIFFVFSYIFSNNILSNSFFIFLFYFRFCSVVTSSSSSYRFVLRSTSFTVFYTLFLPASSGLSITKITTGLNLISSNRALSDSVTSALPLLGVAVANTPIGTYDSTWTIWNDYYIIWQLTIIIKCDNKWLLLRIRINDKYSVW